MLGCVTLASCDLSAPLKDPLNEPDKKVEDGEVDICWAFPTFNWLSSALLPETMTFFQVAIILLFIL